MHYTLVGHTPTPEPEYHKWLSWFLGADTKVKSTEVSETEEVSTIFTGMEGKLFQTTVFGGVMDGHTVHTQTWEDAEKVHDNIVQEIKNKRN